MLYWSNMRERFFCKHCDYKATQKGHLLTHIRSIHECVKFPCEQCDYKATRKGNLLSHLKSTHECGRVHCEQCDYKATWKGDLLKHTAPFCKPRRFFKWPITSLKKALGSTVRGVLQNSGNALSDRH